MASNAGQQGSTEGCRGRVSKTDKTRRSWSKREEEILLASLKEIVAQGWKADNGFRGGYLTKLEESIRKEFPDSDIKGMPHINSKISSWKKSYNSLLGMLDVSGVGFNHKGTFMIDCDNDQWELIVKKDKNALNMRFKSWPMLDDWKEIFGKDRANGVQAEDLMEAVHDMYTAENIAQEDRGAYFNSADEEVPTDEAEVSVCQTEKKCNKGGGSKKKRKSPDEFDRLCDVLGEIGRDTGLRLGDLVTRIGYEFDLGQARQTVFEKLGAISGLSTKEKFEVCEMLADKVQRLEIFIGLPEDAKAQYVAYLLESKLN
ncbi:uncharacterized protein LOC131005840 isoform X2 [Salvia miltiorrhiza]|uniref:uncharacterized protein LOC131005840 isoform X2 n=1 Tax=Salvia miltiorrhiza TaxID=226208 RepID=UPI0025AD076D|nr:uncharacterized protein LOC131005840 isoform X2 [Salvia miltiorrhiza]